MQSSEYKKIISSQSFQALFSLVEDFKSSQFDKRKLVHLMNAFDELYTRRKSSLFDDVFLQNYIGFLTILTEAAHSHSEKIPEKYSNDEAGRD